MRLGAAAVFVKTIGYSPLKTRLASGIGTLQADQFYRLACQSISEQLLEVSPTIQPYWAVAESQSQALAAVERPQSLVEGAGHHEHERDWQHESQEDRTDHHLPEAKKQSECQSFAVPICPRRMPHWRLANQ